MDLLIDGNCFMIDFDFKKKCYSCSACVDSCPKKAITMDATLMPNVDLDKCINCAICELNCIGLTLPKDKVRDYKNKSGSIVKSKDSIIRKTSSSGGVFIHLARAVIQNGGAVCGCIYDDRFMPRHIVTRDMDECKKMMGSKYVKSDMSGCITQMKELTQKGVVVLFSGVPCQVAAVKRCIKSDNLLTVSVVCHGSIERDVWMRFLAEESKLGEITSVTMRDKSKGYLNYGLKFTFDNGTEHITYRCEDGYFLKSFTDGLLERDRCLNCEYKGKYILSDILLGDAWGMDKLHPEFVDNYGCSAVIVLSEQGELLLDTVKNDVDMLSVDCDDIVKNNQRIVSPAPVNPLRKRFNRKIQNPKTNIHKVTRRYARPTITNRIIWKVLKKIGTN